MALFKRRLPTPTDSNEVAGLPELARSRGWQPTDEQALGTDVVERVNRLTWTLYGRRYSQVVMSGHQFVSYETHVHDAYRGEVSGRPVVVANGRTNIGPQHVVDLYEWMGVSICAVQLPTIAPVLLIQPRRLPPASRLPQETPTGNSEFDEQFVLVLAPTVDAQVVTPDVQQRILAHDDWAFVGAGDRFACVGQGAFASADDVSRRLDETVAIVDAFPTALVPARIDRSVDDLVARVDRISSVEEALEFLQSLSDDDRARLAKSGTPLAAFADVRTPDEAMARLESLDMPQRMQLFALFERVEGQ